MPASRAPVTDSPWFWAYLFGAAALVALALAGPKFVHRQAQIEREYQGRQRATQNLAGQEPTVPMSTAERTLITLQPLMLGLAAITLIAWAIFWHHRPRRVEVSQPNERLLPAAEAREQT